MDAAVALDRVAVAMTRYILNSAVITAPGAYIYEHITAHGARSWLTDGTFVSTVGYAETAQALSDLTEVQIPVNRRTIQMEPGDEALVFRLVLPPGTARVAPGAKGALGVEFVREHCEIGVLRRVE
jgi:hypothetical protein